MTRLLAVIGVCVVWGLAVVAQPVVSDPGGAVGRIEGTITLEGRPFAGGTMGLNGYGRGLFEREVVTDADGRFLFSDLPPGKYRLGRVLRPPRRGVECGKVGPVTAPMAFVELREGETATVTLGGGAVVRGRIVVPECCPPAWHAAEFDLDSSGGGAERGCYLVPFEKDRSFRIPDVLPGEYSAHIGLYVGASDSRYGVGQVLLKVSVPEGASGETIDLGDILPHRGTFSRKFSAGGFSFPTLEGGVFRLSRHRGEWVVLHFWSASCPASFGEMCALMEWITSAPEGGTPQVISVNLGDTAEEISAFMGGEDFPWPVVLADQPDSQFAKNLYHINTLPSTTVVRPDGNIQTDDLRGAGLVDDCRAAIAEGDAESAPWESGHTPPGEIISLPMDTSIGLLEAWTPGRNALDWRPPYREPKRLGVAKGEIEIPPDTELVLQPALHPVYDPEDPGVRRLFSRIGRLEHRVGSSGAPDGWSAETVAMAQRMPNLRAVHTAFLRQTLAQGLSGLKTLRELYVHWRVSEQELSLCSWPPSLEFVSLNSPPNNLASLPGIPGLKEVEIYMSDRRYQEGKVEMLAPFLDRPDIALRIMFLRESFTRDDVEYLARFPQIVSLVFASGSFNASPSANLDTLIPLLAPLQRMRRLSFDYGRLSNAGIETLAKFPQLEILGIHNLRSVTDEELKLLATLPKLKFLSVRAGELTDSAVPLFFAMPALEKLYFLENPAISPEGLARLREKVVLVDSQF